MEIIRTPDKIIYHINCFMVGTGGEFRMGVIPSFRQYDILVYTVNIIYTK